MLSQYVSFILVKDSREQWRMQWNACMYAYLGVFFNHNNINVPVSLFFQLVSKEKWNVFKEHLKLTR